MGARENNSFNLLRLSRHRSSNSKGSSNPGSPCHSPPATLSPKSRTFVSFVVPKPSQHPDVFILSTGHDDACFCTWLTQDEIDHFHTNDGNLQLKEWVSSLEIIPSNLELSRS